MRRTIPAIMLCILFLCTSAAVFAEPSASPSEEAKLDRIGVILYMLDEKDKPLANTTVLMQEDLDSEDAYEGETDKQGIMMIPSFPLTGFVMAVRDADNALAGLIDLTLYPGSETKIMNNPKGDHDTVKLADLRKTTLSSHINGTAPLEIAGGADSITMYHYEVQVSQEAGGMGGLFKLAADNEMKLEGVSDGQPGGVIPEPTLPPDDDNRPMDSPTQTTAPSPGPSPTQPSPSPTQTAEPSASQSASGEPSSSQEPSGTSAQPTETGGTLQPTASATQTSGTVSPSPSPTASVQPTPTPIPPSPSPSAAPTTQSNLINMKLFLKNAKGEALPYYKTVLNKSVEATTNGEGEAYYTNVATKVNHNLTVFNAEGKEVGSCGIEFIPGTSTSLASVNTGGTYKVNYQEGTQDVYVELVVSSEGMSVGEASQTPISPGTTSTATNAPSSAGPASSTPKPSEDVIGTPSTTTTSGPGPSLRGYFSNESGTAIPGATIRLRNEDTKALSSAITTADGTFTISQIPPGNYSIGALSPEGDNLGTVNFTAARGNKTQLKEGSNGTLYLAEAPDSDTVYMDLRELGNGTLGLLYAAKSPMLAPAVPATPEPILSAPADLPIIEEQVEATIIEEPESETKAQNNAAIITWIIIACGGAVAAAVYLLTRHARIR